MSNGFIIAGSVTVALGLGGVIASAILYPMMVPVFLTVGAGGAALMGREHLLGALRRCLGGAADQPTVQSPTVNVNLTVNSPTSPPINRRLSVIREQLSPTPHSHIGTPRNAPLTPQAHAVTNLHRHESYNQDGKHFSHDETFNVTEEPTFHESPRMD